VTAGIEPADAVVDIDVNVDELELLLTVVVVVNNDVVVEEFPVEMAMYDEVVVVEEENNNVVVEVPAEVVLAVYEVVVLPVPLR